MHVKYKSNFPLLNQALDEIGEMSNQDTDGRWLETMIVDVGKYVREWDLIDCEEWSDWKERENHFPGVSKQDIGIDAVGTRANGKCVAIQSKSRKLDEEGHGNQITKSELDKFISSTQHDLWEERWLVTNGDNPLAPNARRAQLMIPNRIKMINIGRDLRQEIQARNQKEAEDERSVSKTLMQEEAVEQCVSILRKHLNANSGGCPYGQARGRLILPCGTGKTRISLRIVEELTNFGELSIVLTPSIALVAQVRREYLQFCKKDINALAVCSDKTAGVTKKNEGCLPENDPTLDTSFVSETEVKGLVTTDSDVIAEWLNEYVCGGDNSSKRINVIIGTYQSANRISEAIEKAQAEVEVLIADEAHRTAGIRKPKTKKLGKRIRDFTLCHNQEAFPAKFRVYQTATPRVYSIEKTKKIKDDWTVRTMDDETTFGVELFRRSYVEAVHKGWLCNYRIIAIGVNDEEAFEQANRLAAAARADTHESLKTAHYLRGLAYALAMSGATRNKASSSVAIASCIGFMNTIEKSKTMVKSLLETEVRNFIKKWFKKNQLDGEPARYNFRHLDASSNITERQQALQELDQSTPECPRAILNVGIFGEGTDSPALNAVAFLEPRKSPIDVIQAVGRAMRTAPGKKVGYIICPILIPPNRDPEEWLRNSEMGEGWQELGEILLALRAHDERIETKLAHLLEIYYTAEPSITRNLVGIANNSGENNVIRYYEHEGQKNEIKKVVKLVALGKSTPRKSNLISLENRSRRKWRVAEPGRLITAKLVDGKVELREDSVQRTKLKDGSLGKVDLTKCKKRMHRMINKPGEKNSGRKVRPKPPKKKLHQESLGLRLLRLSDAVDNEHAITLNLLERSGLRVNRVERDLNILEDSVREAARHIAEDNLEVLLAKLFQIDKLQSSQKRANASTIASLILMNAAMMQQRIDETGFIDTKFKLADAKNHPNVIEHLRRSWNYIIRTDYETVFEPAIDILDTIEDKSSRKGGLERALHHIAKEAERIAETYSNMGMDHAGPLFNRVMGDQASDGAYFTRPLAAVMAASLALDCCEDIDWTNEEDWKANKIVDLACGSGTLLAAALTDMRRRAKSAGANKQMVRKLDRVAVEHTLKGFDINAVSLQLAAAQLSIGNAEVRFNNMGLYRLPYGRSRNNWDVSAGSLELLGQKEIVQSRNELAIEDSNQIEAEAVWRSETRNARMESAVDAAKASRIIIMNPPFTNRTNMGKKFSSSEQKALRIRVDRLEQALVRADPIFSGFSDKNSLRPLFVALADHCLRDDGVLVEILPTIALTTISGAPERQVLANRYHIHTIVTCHLPGQYQMSQNSNINESLLVAKKLANRNKPDTRFVHLDRFPMNEQEAYELCKKFRNCEQLDDGWGEVSYWPSERMGQGDWTPAVWRDSHLANAAWEFANHPIALPLLNDRTRISQTGRELSGKFHRLETENCHGFPIIDKSGANGQQRLRSTPDEWWQAKDTTKPRSQELLFNKSGFLLVTASQRIGTARLTAVADSQAYVGNSWLPVTGVSVEEAKALSVFLNSTLGYMQIMNNRGRTLDFPLYRPKSCSNIMVPNVHDYQHVRSILSQCFDRTCDITVPQFRDGECDIRILWDRAVEEAMEWQRGHLDKCRWRLHREPSVSGLGYHQYLDSPELESVKSV